MNDFALKCLDLFENIGEHKNMVLSTSLNEKVTSRMMSIVVIDGAFYFQTDCHFRKYKQIMSNPNVALCADNLQIEGLCREIGRPHDHSEFCALYQRHFSTAYELYSGLESERLFAVKPVYIQKWLYENGCPFVETFDFANKFYRKKHC